MTSSQYVRAKIFENNVIFSDIIGGSNFARRFVS